MYELKFYSASEINALYYIAFKDYEDEVKRKEEEERKKKQKENDKDARARMIREAQARGIRLPARAYHDIEQKQNPEMSGLDLNGFQDLIDELD